MPKSYYFWTLQKYLLTGLQSRAIWISNHSLIFNWINHKSLRTQLALNFLSKKGHRDKLTSKSHFSQQFLNSSSHSANRQHNLVIANLSFHHLTAVHMIIMTTKARKKEEENE